MKTVQITIIVEAPDEEPDESFDTLTEDLVNYAISKGFDAYDAIWEEIDY